MILPAEEDSDSPRCVSPVEVVDILDASVEKALSLNEKSNEQAKEMIGCQGKRKTYDFLGC